MFKYNFDLNSFMNINKKGIHSHITIIFISSVIMIILFLTLFGSIFKNDHIKCQDLDFNIVKAQKVDNGAKITLRNNIGVDINFDLVTEKTTRVILGAGELKDFSINSDSSVEIVPIYISNVEKEEFKCRGRSKSFDISRLISG